MALFHHPMATQPLRGAPVGRPGTEQAGADQTEFEEGRLLIGPAFWIGGLLSVAAWTGLAALFGLF